MRSTRAQSAQNRDRIIAEAARMFRERGFDGIGVAELMRRLGLTQGGFYGHFDSKAELMALACHRATADMIVTWRERADAAPGDPLGAIVGPYLSTDHRDDPGNGCLMAALGPEVARQGPPVRRAVTEALGNVLDALAERIPGADRSEARTEAIRLFVALVGAIVAARAVDDPALSEEILAAIRPPADPR